MIDFSVFKPGGQAPIYLQILMFVKRGIAAGTIKDEDELPSRRTVSALLGINPNTVQKAFAALEEEGLIESRTGAKSRFCLDSRKADSVKKDLLAFELDALTEAFKEMGLTKEEALAMLSARWDAPGEAAETEENK